MHMILDLGLVRIDMEWGFLGLDNLVCSRCHRPIEDTLMVLLPGIFLMIIDRGSTHLNCLLYF